MGEKASSVQYLKRLVEWAGGRAKFCALTGILAPNLSAYLNGTKPIAWKRLESATRHVFGTPPAFVKVLEGFDLFEHGLPTVKQLPHEPGVYAFFDSAMRVIDWGKATDLYAEVRQTLNRKKMAKGCPWGGKKRVSLVEVTTYVSAYKIERGDAVFRHDLELLGLRLLVNTTYNTNRGKFKRTS